jgi:hypothetical protein
MGLSVWRRVHEEMELLDVEVPTASVSECPGFEHRPGDYVLQTYFGPCFKIL